MFGLPTKLLKKIRDIPKGLSSAVSLAKGIYYCESCLKKTIKKKTNDRNAFKKSIKSGMYEPVDNGFCVYCSNPANYKVQLGNAQRAIKEIEKND